MGIVHAGSRLGSVTYFNSKPKVQRMWDTALIQYCRRKLRVDENQDYQMLLVLTLGSDCEYLNVQNHNKHLPSQVESQKMWECMNQRTFIIWYSLLNLITIKYSFLRRCILTQDENFVEDSHNDHFELLIESFYPDEAESFMACQNFYLWQIGLHSSAKFEWQKSYLRPWDETETVSTTEVYPHRFLV